jgi:hypothetical protein
VEFGEHAEMLELMPAGKGPVPDPPELWLENAPYLNAWSQIHTSRPHGMTGVAGIAPTEVECWARHCWLRQGDQSEFIRRILALDSAYCIAVNKKQAKEAPPPS